MLLGLCTSNWICYHATDECVVFSERASIAGFATHAFGLYLYTLALSYLMCAIQVLSIFIQSFFWLTYSYTLLYAQAISELFLLSQVVTFIVSSDYIIGFYFLSLEHQPGLYCQLNQASASDKQVFQLFRNILTLD